ncbi:MAG: BatD family protein [Acidobacteriota bacterium]
MTPRPLLGLLLAVGLLTPGAAARAQSDVDPSVDVVLSPSGPLGVGETARLEITVRLGSGGDTSLPRFELENFDLVTGPSQTTSLQFINGRTSHSKTFIWLLRAGSIGTARVHGGKVTVAGSVLRLPERTAEVVAEPPPRQRQRASLDPFDQIFGRPSDRDDPFDRFRSRRRQSPEPRAPEIFLRAVASPSRPVVGQQVLYTLYLYTDVNVRSVAPTRLPDFKGFWTTVIPQPEGEVQPERVTHEGREIGRVVLLQRALFPRREGRLEIEPVQAEMRAMLGDRSPFGSILPRLGEITRASNAVSVTVRPLPDPPATFDGVVGRLQLDAALEPRELEVGEAATLTLRLHGQGHLQGVSAPTVPQVDGLEVFPPQQQSDEALRGTRVVGNRSWSFVLVPQRPGRIELPPIEMVSFDPREGRYETLRSTELALEVRGATSMARDGGGTAELHSIRRTVVPLERSAGWSWSLRHLLFGLPLLVALGLVLARRARGTGGGQDARGARHRLLRALADAADEGRPRETAAAIESAWRRFLEERWRIAPGTPSTQWQRHLEAAGARGEAAAELVRLADDVHYLRYAPKLSSTDELQRELLERSRRLAKALR